MRLTFHRPLFDLFPGMRVVVAIARGLDNAGTRPDIQAELHDAWAGAAGTVAPYGNPQSHPNVVPWRLHLRAAGARPHDFPSSIEALLRRASKGGEPPLINPLVDFYNAVSLALVVPVGGFDLHQIPNGNVDVRLTAEGDLFDALDATKPLPVPPGEVAYAAGSTVLTRHLVWRQSRPALITPHTTDAMLLSEVLGEVDPRVLDQVRKMFADGVRERFAPSSLDVFVLDQDLPELLA
jgi:DNA/RNA-binding domain of Phe-tRNA-synthetase-like protein